ncbi:ADP-ribose pyrophosphatase [Corynebacterium aquilae DSM 44791]|uniref:ADP-ribose pyrophosphatase n=1 Tax=Corynebacterium aquilae DSM 44791 TaxID=1431546 RepID=A0A1L7CFT1_9CORY|nr:ADP-ribose pyrophosphatase [Corynebacterium aquilae DSM 44791]
MSSGRHQFEVVDSEVLVDAAIIAVRRDTVKMPQGRQAFREVVEHFGAVAVVAVNDQGQVALINQYRRPVDAHLWELPAGLMDVPGEDPVRCAQRELAEEAGLVAARWDLVTDIYTTPGIMDEAVRIFLASELGEIPAEAREEAVDEEADVRVQWVDFDEAVGWVCSGKVRNAIAATGLMVAHRMWSAQAPLRSVDEPFTSRPTALARRRAQESRS